MGFYESLIILPGPFATSEMKYSTITSQLMATHHNHYLKPPLLYK
jgi:hypothetical protein